MQADEFYILVLIFFNLIIGYVVPRYFFKLKFLPIGYLVIAAASTILGFVLHFRFYGDTPIWEDPVIGVFWSTVVCFAISGLLFFKMRNKPKMVAQKTSSQYEKSDIQEVKSMIANNDLEEACEKLLLMTSGERKKNDELLLIKRKIQTIKSENRIGILTNERKDIGYSTVSFNLLEITNSL